MNAYEKGINQLVDEYLFRGKSRERCLGEAYDLAATMGEDPSWSAVDFDKAVTEAEAEITKATSKGYF